VFAASSIRIEAVGETAERSDRHISPLVWVNGKTRSRASL